MKIKQWDNMAEHTYKSTDKNFDKETALKIYKYLKKPPNMKQDPLFASIRNSLDCWEQVYKLELFEQFLFIKHYIIEELDNLPENATTTLYDDKNYMKWMKQHQDYFFYDPRLKIVQKMSQKLKNIEMLFIDIRSKQWRKRKLKVWYWKIRYRSKWKHIKLNSEWNYPLFVPVQFNEAELKLEKEIKKCMTK